MKTKLFLAALLACLTTTAFARIGETEAQLIQRYGEPERRSPQGDGITLALFHHGEFNIIVGLLNGVCQSEIYQKTGTGQINDQEILVLMKANFGVEKGWTERELVTGKVYHFRGCTASYDTISRQLTILRDDFIERYQASEAERLSGF